MVSLFLFHISQNINDGWNTYSDAIVVAADEESARLIHPNGRRIFPVDEGDRFWALMDWCDPEFVTVELIGVAVESLQENTVVCASFHAG